MKRKKIIYMLAIFIAISWFLPGASATIENLGTIPYRDFKTIEKPGQYNLTLVYGEVNDSAVKVEIIYDSVFNSSYIRFVSNEITPDYWFDNKRHQEYIFQDENTLQLFSVFVNFSTLNMPENPVIMLDQIMEELENKTLEYNNTYNQLSSMTNNWTSLDNDYTNLTQNYTALVVDLNESANDIKTLNHNLNQSINNAQKLQTNLTKYRNYYNGINSLQDDFWHENIKYPTLAKLNRDYADLQSSYGTTTLVLVILIIFGVIITWFFSRREKGFMKLNDTELDRDLGYSRESKKIDNTILSFFKNAGKKLIPKSVKNTDGPGKKITKDNVDKIIEDHKIKKTEDENKKQDKTSEQKVDRKILIDEITKSTINELDRRGILS